MIKHIFTIVLLFVSLTYGYTQEIITENGRAYKLHTVQKGEGLYRLSVNNNTTQEEIIAANPKLKETGLNVGMTIRIPLKETIRENTPITEYTTHVVAKGETAYSAAIGTSTNDSAALPCRLMSRPFLSLMIFDINL